MKTKNKKTLVNPTNQLTKNKNKSWIDDGYCINPEGNLGYEQKEGN